MNNIFEAYDLVREFYVANHQIIEADEVPVSTVLLRQRLMLEELGETAIAAHQKNSLEFVDGLCDLLYVVAGTAVSFGARFIDGWVADEFKGPMRFPDEHELTFDLIYIGQRVMMVCQVIEYGSRLQTKVITQAVKDVADAIGQSCVSYNVDLRACFREVHRSNLTKRLGGATDGKKYGNDDPKGAGFSPANLKQILGLE